MNKFSVGDMIPWAWKHFRERPWIFIGMLLVVFVVNIVTSMVLPEGITWYEDVGLQFSAVRLVSSILSFLIQTLVGIGMIAFILKAHDNLERAQISDLWHPQDFVNYLLTVILYGLMVMVGFVLLIVPGVILSIMFQFAPYLVVDKHMRPIEALKESMRITSGHKWQLFLLLLLIIALNIVGALAILIGLVVTIPVTYLALAHAYRTLEHSANEVAA